MSTDTGHSAVNTDPRPHPPQLSGAMWKIALAGLVAAFVVLGGYDLASISGQDGSNGAAPASSAAKPAAAPSTIPASAAAPAASASAPAMSTSGGQAHALGITSIAAFGPGGTADGDNPASASRVLDVSTDQPWYSQWYTTAEFGGLQSGTGLLLDMGETVTVADVRLMLGTAPGADVQLRVGNSPDLNDLQTVAAAADAAGSVRLAATTRATGRYVLVWFTRLPPDGQGHYQVSVYSAYVDGTAGS